MENKHILDEKEPKDPSFAYLAGKVLEPLTDRTKEVVEKRFGLSGGKAKTLDAIGKDYGITRERVRQILVDSLKKIFQKGKESADLLLAKRKIVLLIESGSGIINQEKFLSQLDSSERNAVLFFVNSLPEIKVVEIRDLMKKCWIVSEGVLEKVKKINSVSREFLNSKKVPVSKKNLIGNLAKELPDFQPKEIEDFLSAISQICSNNFGKWGMCSWPEINPKRTRDKIYLILKETKKPIHFSKIAKLIDDNQLSSRKAHPQTVHNELIKDKRFVLVGRGIYALSEWGYDRGTVKEVLQKLLKEKGPMKKDEIFEEIFKIRKVKKATIMINLNNSDFFLKKKEVFEAR